MTKTQLMNKIAKLETIQDLMITELENIDAQLKRIGFENGLATIKACAIELVAMQKEGA